MSAVIRPAISIIPATEKVRAQGNTELDILVRLTVPDFPISLKRPGLNLGLVLDRSGSMSGNKLKHAKMAMGYCVDQLLPEDFVSIVIFDDKVEVLVPPVSGNERKKIKEILMRVRSGGTTALHAAWVTGGRKVAENLDPKYVNRIILVTDGLANEGETNPEVFVRQAEGLFRRGITTTTIGVGNDFNEDLLVPMANAAGGNSWFVEGPGDFQRIFATEMGNLLREVCTRVSIGLETADGVEILDVLNDFERTSTGKYRLPNLLAGESLDILMRVLLPGGLLGRAPVFRATVGWSLQGKEGRQYTEEEAFITYVSTHEAEAQEMHQEVVKIRQLLGSARARRQAMAEMDSGEYAEAKSLLKKWALSSQTLSNTIQDNDLAQDSFELERLFNEIEADNDLKFTRKKMMYESLYQQRSRKQSSPKKEET